MTAVLAAQAEAAAKEVQERLHAAVKPLFSFFSFFQKRY
jgi:hypothetical protein